MKRIALVSIIACATLLPLAAYADSPTVIAAATAVKWVDAPPAAGLPKGAQIAPLFGNAASDGQYALRVKVPAGAKFVPHTHPNDENVTVLSGSIHIGLGDKFDRSKATTVKAGGFIHMPKGTPHYAWTTEATVFQSNSVGPSGRTYLNPADAPKTN
jgi:quercetin dioxygenase-like cupin family protein